MRKMIQLPDGSTKEDERAKNGSSGLVAKAVAGLLMASLGANQYFVTKWAGEIEKDASAAQSDLVAHKQEEYARYSQIDKRLAVVEATTQGTDKKVDSLGNKMDALVERLSRSR